VGKGKGKKKEREGKEREREREKKKAQAVIFPNRPGQSEISVNYTVLYRKEQYSM
jgi:lipocalin